MNQTVERNGMEIWVNGQKLPALPGGSASHSIAQIGGRLYVDGYELISGQWKRTLRAIWHLFF